MKLKQQTPQGNLAEIDKQALDLLTANGIIPPQAGPAQVSYFFNVCQRVGADPFNGEASLVPYWSGGQEKFATIIQKGFYFRKAAETAEFAGLEDVRFDVKPDGSYKTMADYKRGEYPTTCTATVYRVVKGVRCPFTFTVRFDEYARTKKTQDGRVILAALWKAKPFHMVAKVAQVHALRAGFADIFSSNAFIEEEIGALEGEVLAADEVDAPEMTLTEEQKEQQINAALEFVKTCRSLPALGERFRTWPEHVKENEEVFAACKKRKAELTTSKKKAQAQDAQKEAPKFDINALKEQLTGKSEKELTAIALALDKDVLAREDVKELFRKATEEAKKAGK